MKGLAFIYLLTHRGIFPFDRAPRRRQRGDAPAPPRRPTRVRRVRPEPRRAAEDDWPRAA